MMELYGVEHTYSAGLPLMGVTGCPSIDAGSSRDKGRAGHDGKKGTEVLHCVYGCVVFVMVFGEKGWKCSREGLILF